MVLSTGVDYVRVGEATERRNAGDRRITFPATMTPVLKATSKTVLIRQVTKDGTDAVAVDALEGFSGYRTLHTRRRDGWYFRG